MSEMLVMVVLHRIIAINRYSDAASQHAAVRRFFSTVNNRNLQRKLVQQVRHQPTATTQSTHRGNYIQLSGLRTLSLLRVGGPSATRG